VFLEDELVRGSMTPRKIDLEEKRVYVPTPIIQELIFPVHADVAPPVKPTIDATPSESPNTTTDEHYEEAQEPPAVTNETHVEPLRRSQRARRSTTPNDYVTYMNEDMNEVVLDDDPTSFKEAMKSKHSSEWFNAMKDEIKSMSTNDVWDLVEIPDGAKTVGCKWVYKTKRDSKGNVESFKARLVAKGFTQRESVDYNETFSPVSSKDSFRIIMVLVAHYDLELHQMDVKTERRFI